MITIYWAIKFGASVWGTLSCTKDYFSGRKFFRSFVRNPIVPMPRYVSYLMNYHCRWRLIWINLRQRWRTSWKNMSQICNLFLAFECHDCQCLEAVATNSDEEIGKFIQSVTQSTRVLKDMEVQILTKNILQCLDRHLFKILTSNFWALSKDINDFKIAHCVLFAQVNMHWKNGSVSRGRKLPVTRIEYIIYTFQKLISTSKNTLSPATKRRMILKTDPLVMKQTRCTYITDIYN